MGEEGVRIEVILVDFQKDKKLAMLKQLITTLVSGSNPASMIKKIAGTVEILLNDFSLFVIGLHCMFSGVYSFSLNRCLTFTSVLHWKALQSLLWRKMPSCSKTMVLSCLAKLSVGAVELGQFCSKFWLILLDLRVGWWW